MSKHLTKMQHWWILPPYTVGGQALFLKTGNRVLVGFDCAELQWCSRRDVRFPFMIGVKTRFVYEFYCSLLPPAMTHSGVKLLGYILTAVFAVSCSEHLTLRACLSKIQNVAIR